ncbi:MAG TPA: hypothetical protein VNG89_16945 [Vicinamibacterales bacterium]|nr:hypothetical protein [Vicinamibacterales bacterium]
MQSFSKLATFIVTAAIASACGFDHSRNVLVPTEIPPGTTTTTNGTPGASAMPLLGTWVETSVVGAKAIGALPTPNSCSAFQFTMTSQTASQASGSFTAQCPGNLTLTGTISGQLGGPTIPMVITGLATAPGEAACPFTLNGTGVPQNANELRIDYTGTTCLGPVTGSATLRQASSGGSTPPPAPTPAPTPTAPQAPPSSDPLVGCGALVSGGAAPIRVIECLHDRLNPPHTAAGAFEITKRVAWAYRNEGAGLLIKNGGENIVSWKGRSFSASRVCLPNGHIYKVLSDVPTTNAPSFQDNDYVDPSLYVPAIDPNS